MNVIECAVHAVCSSVKRFIDESVLRLYVAEVVPRMSHCAQRRLQSTWMIDLHEELPCGSLDCSVLQPYRDTGYKKILQLHEQICYVASDYFCL